MRKGDISNRMALGVGVDWTIMVEVKRTPVSFMGVVLRQPHYGLTADAKRLAQHVHDKGYRLVVYVVGLPDAEFYSIQGLLADLPCKVEWAKDWANLGNNMSGEVSIYFTKNDDFYDGYRYLRNMRAYKGVYTVSSLLGEWA